MAIHHILFLNFDFFKLYKMSPLCELLLVLPLLPVKNLNFGLMASYSKGHWYWWNVLTFHSPYSWKSFNPLSAMVGIWHHLIVSFKVWAQKGFIGTWMSWLKCSTAKLNRAIKCLVMVECQMYGLWGTSPSLHYKSSWHSDC
jgi:hypothetical protein